MLGRSDRDIHIIEVTNSNRSVVVELLGDGGSGGGGGSIGVLRNITLVLRAAHSTAWQLVTTQLHGTVTLLVGGEDQVENTSVPGGARVAVVVRREDLPVTFDQLLLTVLTSIGPPTSYTRANATTHLSLTVGAGTDNHINFPSHLRNHNIPTVYAEEPASVIRAGLSVACTPSAMTLSLPYATAERVGGVVIALLDRACVGSRNGTHIVLKAEFTRCKFEKKQGTRGKFVYTNLLSIELGPPLSDDEDLVGSGYGSEDEYYPSALPSLPVTCEGDTLPPSLPPLPPLPPRPPSRLPAVLPPPPPPSHRGYSKVPSGVQGASYTLTLYTDASLTHPIASTPAADALLPTSVALHTRLYAQAALASVLPWTDTTTTTTSNLRVVLEECWVSNTTSPTPPHTTTAAAHLLLRKSCRVHPSVSVEAPTFSFQILPDYTAMDIFYLHCQLGVCSSDTLPRPTVIKCTEPSLYCSKPALLKAFERQPASSSLQTLTLGPLTSATTTKSALFGGITHTTSSSQGLHHTLSTTRAAAAGVAEAEEEEKTQIVVLRGLSTEMVVGIALASFIIGVCLTATLWVIHMKTDPRRQKRTDSSSAPRNSGYDLSAHSGSSTPSSQAPMTA
nr:transforming growth factor beta receptor 3 [Scylla paramamosain]